MNCVEIQELLSAYFDGELPQDDSTLVKMHLVGCNDCRLELDQFNNLSSLASDLEIPSVPASVWSGIVRGLDERDRESAEANSVVTLRRPNAEPSTRRSILWAAAIAATLLLGIFGWSIWGHNDNHDHHAMIAAMEEVTSDLDSDRAIDLLRDKFGGKKTSFDEAVTLVGYRPAAAAGLPAGYSVENVQVLDMPCCRCTQTACLRPDNSRLFIYEHDNAEPGWFAGKPNRQCMCGGKDCQVTELNDQLVATWKKDNRHITVIGARDQAEIELIANSL